MYGKPRLGDILVQAGLIDELQLHTALGEQQEWGNRLGVTLVKLGMIEEQELVRALSRKLGVPAVRLDGKKIDPDVLELVPRELAERHACLPLFTKREAGVDVVYIGMEDPSNLNAVDDLSFHTGMRVRPVIVAPTELWGTLERSYSGSAGQQEDAPALGETPIEPGDTAPDLSDAVPAVRAEQAAPASEAPAPTQQSAPESEAGASDAAGRSRVPTRAILQAVTQLLIDKDLLGRDELFERIEAVRAKGDDQE